MRDDANDCDCGMSLSVLPEARAAGLCITCYLYGVVVTKMQGDPQPE